MCCLLDAPQAAAVDVPGRWLGGDRRAQLGMCGEESFRASRGRHGGSRAVSSVNPGTPRCYALCHLERAREAAVSHAALVHDGLFFLLIAVFLLVLLVMLIFAVIQLARDSGASLEPPVRKTAGTARSRLPRFTPPAGTADRAGNGEVPGQDVVHAPEVAGVPPWGPAPKPPDLG
jgi:hypothetical protein